MNLIRNKVLPAQVSDTDGQEAETHLDSFSGQNYTNYYYFFFSAARIGLSPSHTAHYCPETFVIIHFLILNAYYLFPIHSRRLLHNCLSPSECKTLDRGFAWNYLHNLETLEIRRSRLIRAVAL